MMPLQLTWPEIAIRLLLTIAAGAILGFNREAHGHAAGLRTTILVTLAASVSMIQMNLLLPLEGKTPGSFAVMDLMRLPLGILTGVGFLGGGAILKKGGSITGITTAATLWIATVIGLCLGGGQVMLGVVATALSVTALWAMKWVDLRIPRERSALLVVASERAFPIPELEKALAPLGYRVRLRKQNQVAAAPGEDAVETHFDLKWKRAEIRTPSLDFLEVAAALGKIKSFEFEAGDH